MVTHRPPFLPLSRYISAIDLSPLTELSGLVNPPLLSRHRAGVACIVSAAAAAQYGTALTGGGIHD